MPNTMPNATPVTAASVPAEPVKLRGWARWNQLQAEYAAQREHIAAGLLAGLGREPAMTDKIAAKNIAAMEVEATRLEARGKPAIEQRRLVAQWTRTSGFRPAKAEPKPASTPEYLKRYSGGGA
jgi:hypothetical protein